ncbi:MAG: DUF2782 domain-containing protein [Betaproteobacteria bacterium]|nr:DUF2782 domain-containing protein [Betaproteobacteria bacterium]MSQ89189.1 DUF2782 domain-containing protein [Betaproteobacteria bacterium]
MRRVLFLALSVAAAGALAQQQLPPKLEPLPEAPPPPLIRDGADEPRVRITPQEGDRVEEVRDGGRVVMLKVTPPGGISYYLMDLTGNGNLTRRDSLDPGLRVPLWTIKSFD